MILSGRAIQKHIGSDIIIEPYDPKRVNPNSYNLSLHNELLVYTGNTLDIKQANPTECIVIPEEGLVLEPNRLYLGRTNEYTKTERYVPMLEGRSSTGRLKMWLVNKPSDLSFRFIKKRVPKHSLFKINIH